MRCTLASKYNCAHVDVVALYRWLYPTRMRAQAVPEVDEEFSHPELTKVMRYHKHEPKRVREYKDWRAEHKLGDEDVDNTITPVSGVANALSE